MKNLAPASPLEMSASARAGEIAAILAAAIVRTLVADEPIQRANSTTEGLGLPSDQRVHTTPYPKEKL